MLGLPKCKHIQGSNNAVSNFDNCLFTYWTSASASLKGFYALFLYTNSSEAVFDNGSKIVFVFIIVYEEETNNIENKNTLQR